MTNRTKKWIAGALAATLLACAMALLLGNLSSGRSTGCGMSGDCPFMAANSSAGQENSTGQGQNLPCPAACLVGGSGGSGGCGGSGAGCGMMGSSGSGMMGGSARGTCPMMRGPSS